MGACLSSSSAIDAKLPSAYVISVNGELRQYAVPTNVSQVLQSETTTVMMQDQGFFLCNSDRLLFDDFIPSLDPGYQLQPGQIYFMLPASKLQYRLSASDMAALAVKASAALDDLNNINKTMLVSCRKKKKKQKKNKKSNSRISPLLLLQVNELDDHDQSNNNTSSRMPPLGVSMRSASVRKLQRLSSRRAKLAVRSFRKLMTIHEGSVLSIY